jgi:hypothetical protein
VIEAAGKIALLSAETHYLCANMLRMFKIALSSALILMGCAVMLGPIGCHTAGARPNSSNSTAPALSDATPKEIHVDQNCHILPDKKTNPVICHLESVLTSSHPEETIHEGVAGHSMVNIAEQEYLLQNVTGEPVIFVVEHHVPKGWSVDSDPQPTEIHGTKAVFRVGADPGQIVRLHVGLRHAIPVSDVASARSSSN